MNKTVYPSHICGPGAKNELCAPASKSSMQRAIVCALLAQGKSCLRHPCRSDDALAALHIARTLGAAVHDAGSAIYITGAPAFAPHAVQGALARPPESGAAPVQGAFARPPTAPVLHCGESGLCMRMFAPVVALLPGEWQLTGQGSLAKRPMRLLEAPLRAFGAQCETRDGLQPVRITGRLQGGLAEIDAKESSQLLTGLLLALPLSQCDSVLTVRNPVSTGYLDLTLDTMRAFGVCARRNKNFTHCTVDGGQRYRACDFTVEGDWSGAAFLLVAAAIACTAGASLRVKSLRTASSQPDKAILEALVLAGASPCIESDSTDDSIIVLQSPLRAFSFDATDCPDLFPPLVALAAYCHGKSRIKGAGRLLAKESDRASVLVQEFSALGLQIWREADELCIVGGDISGGSVQSHGDHRIAMALAVAALGARACVHIQGIECVAKSWPDFFEALAAVGAKIL